MEAICREIEQAAKNTQNPDQNIRRQAETQLKQFQVLPNALEISKFILDNSNQSTALFHAAITIKENLIRQRQDLQKWVHYLLSYTMEKHVTLAYHVRGALLQTIAIVTKITWLSAKDPVKIDVMNGLNDLMSNQSVDSKKLGLGLILALLNEFQFTNGTSLGLPIDFHHSCQAAFQKTHLLEIFKLVLQATNHAASQRDNEEFLVFSLACCEKILSWEFGANTTALFGNKSEVYIDKEKTALKLPLEWKSVILVPEVIHMFFQLAQVYDNEESIAAKSISCIVQLAGIHGPVFETPQSQQGYIANFISSFSNYLNAIVRHVNSSEFSPDSGDKIFALSQISKQLFRFSSLQLLASCPGVLEVLKGLAQVTIVCMKLKVENLDDSWFLDAADEILLMWASLTEKLQEISSQELSDLMNYPEIGAFLNLLGQISSEIVKTYIEMRVLADPSDEDDDLAEKDLDVYGDQLLNISVLARLQVGEVVQRLINVLTEKRNNLMELFANFQHSHSPLMMKLQEQLHWGVLIAGHILCDSAYGETPMIPDSLLKLSRSTSPDPVVQLSTTVFSILDGLGFEPNSLQHNMCSPLLMETLFWFCDRWSSTYLFQKEQSTQSLQQSFGGVGGKEVLLFLLTKLHHQAALWYSAEEVILEIISVLQGLSKNSTSRDVMIELEKFSEIVGFLLSNMSRLPTVSHSPIVQTIITIASHTSNETMRNQYCSKLCSSIEESLLSVVQRPDFQQQFQSTDVREQIVIALQQFGGLAASVDDSTTVMIFNSCSRFFPTFVKLLDLYHSYPDVELFILTIFRDLIKNQSIDSLQPENHQLLYQTVHDLIQVYAKNEIGRHRQANSFEEEELFEDLSILLNLLAELITSEYEGFERETVLARIQKSQFEIDVPKVVFVGVNSLLPLITKEMLEYPSICLDYMHLVGLLVDYFPDRLVTLPSSLQSSLLESLLFGTHQPLSRISDYSFKAIQSLGLYNWVQSVSGMCSCNTGKSTANMIPSLQILLTQILQGLLTEPLDLNILENAADSVFAVSMCVPDTLRNLFTSLLSGPASAVMTPHINNLMQVLSDQHQKQLEKLVQGQIEIGWGSAGLERYPSLKPYRKLFRIFIIEGRAALLVK